MKILKFDKTRRKPKKQQTFRNSNPVDLEEFRIKNTFIPLISGQECLECTDYGDTVYQADFRRKKLKSTEYHGCLESFCRKTLKDFMSNPKTIDYRKRKVIVTQRFGNLSLALELNVHVASIANNQSQAHEVTISSKALALEFNYIVYKRNKKYGLVMMLGNRLYNPATGYHSLDDICFAIAPCTGLQDLIKL